MKLLAGSSLRRWLAAVPGPLWGLMLVALLLRLYRLGWHDFWYDEIVSLRYARVPWNNWNAPLYWLILHFWTAVSGTSEFALRLPSAFFSSLAVGGIFILGRQIFSPRSAMIAALLCAFSPFQLWYAQEARPYALLLFLSVLSSSLLWRFISRGRDIKAMAAFAAVSAAGVCTDYLFTLLLVIQYALAFSLRRTKWGLAQGWPFLAGAAALTLYAGKFFTKFFFVRQGFWVPAPGIKSLAATFENFFLGYNSGAAGYLLADILIIAVLLIMVSRIKKSGAGSGLIFCSLLFFLPLGLVFIFSRLFVPVYLDRSLIIFSPYFYLIIAGSVDAVNLSRVRQVIILLLFALLAYGDHAFFSDSMSTLKRDHYHHVGTYLKKPFRPIADFMLRNSLSGDVFAVTSLSPPIIPALEHYSREKIQFWYLYLPGAIDTNWNRPVVEGGNRVPVQRLQTLAFKRLWIISSDVGLRAGGLDENSQAVKTWLENNFRLEFSQEIDGLWLFRYSRR